MHLLTLHLQHFHHITFTLSSFSPKDLFFYKKMEELTKTNPCKTWEEEMYWKHFHALHFYQVLPKDFLHHLALPSKFSKYMANKLDNNVSLIGPSGASWDVHLSKTGTGSLDLVGDGWNDFAKFYNLEENFLLVFKYKQSSIFEVLIFDQKNSCEKESSYFVKKRLPEPNYRTDRKRCVSEPASTEILEDNDDGVGDDVGGGSDCVLSKKPKKVTAETPRTSSDEFSEDNHNDSEFVKSDKTTDNIIVEFMSSGGRKNRQRSKRCVSNEAADNDEGGPPKSKAQSLKKPGDGNNTTWMLNESDEMEQIATEDGIMNGDGPPGKNSSPKLGIKSGRPAKRTTPKRSKKVPFKGDDSGRSKRLSTREYTSHRRPVTSDEKDDAFKRASEASTKGNFIVVMPPTSVYKRFYLSFPTDWIHKNMGKQNQEVILQMGKKTWVTMFHCYTSRSNSGGLSSGWKNFAIENNLEEFDVCLFKPASKKEDPTFTLDVEIFRVVEEITPLTPHVSSI